MGPYAFEETVTFTFFHSHTPAPLYLSGSQFLLNVTCYEEDC